MAGHFLLELLPKHASDWGAPHRIRGKWRLCGQDGVVELVMTRPQRFQYKLQDAPSRTQHDREHLLVESSLQACSLHEARCMAQWLIDFCLDFDSSPSEAKTSRASCSCTWIVSIPRRCSNGGVAGTFGSSTAGCGTTKAFSFGYCSAPTCATCRAISQCCQLQGLATSSRIYAVAEDLARGASALCHPQDDGFCSFGVPVASRSNWISHVVPGGQHAWQHDAPQWISRTTCCHSQGSHAPRQGGGLPSLKRDLVRLATLLHQDFEEKDTVEELKGKIRGPLAAVSQVERQG